MQDIAAEGSKPFSFLSHLFSDRRIAPMLVLGFASAIPYQLVYITQSAWLCEAKVPIATIGLMSELTLAYKFKFLWAPFLDRYDAPVFGRLLGRRRGWIVVSQIAVIAALAGVALGDPAHWLARTVAFSLALGFAGATQDVVIDGWRISVAPAKRQALMASWSEVGYRFGVLATGAGALLLADRVGWRAAYLGMALLMTPGMLAAFFAPAPEADKTATHPPYVRLHDRRSDPRIDDASRTPGCADPRTGGWVSHARLHLERNGRAVVQEPALSDTDIATVTKLFGFWVGLGGTFLASYIIPRLGMMASLLVGTVSGSASHLALAYLAAHGDHGGSEFWTFRRRQPRQFRLCVRVDRADHLHVFAGVDRTGGQPICAADIDLRVAR
jgi:PAT family beta-lactamase induction signal transducer AmpG